MSPPLFPVESEGKAGCATIEDLEVIVASTPAGSRQHDKAAGQLQRMKEKEKVRLEDEQKSLEAEEKDLQSNSQLKFKCPYHFCDTCNEFYGRHSRSATRGVHSGSRRPDPLIKCIGELLLIYICNFHVLNHLLLIYICKLHWIGHLLGPVGPSCDSNC